MNISFTSCPDAYPLKPPSPTVLSDQSVIKTYLKQRVYEIEQEKYGFERKRFVVGCGRCAVCETEKISRREMKWRGRLIGAIEEFRENGFLKYCKGKEYVTPPGHTFFQTLTVSNEHYPGADMFGGERLKDTTIRALNSNPRFLERSYQHLKSIWQRITANANLNRYSIRYVVFVEWGSTNTRRIHFHIFWFVPGEVQSGYDFCERFLDRWRDQTQTTQGETTLIENTNKAVAYATTYSTKVLSDHRVMSSKFSFEDYEVKWRLEFQGLPIKMVDGETKSGYHKKKWWGGVDKWLGVLEKFPLSGVSEAPDPDALLNSLSLYKDGLSVLGVVELDEPSHSPFKGGMIRICEVNEDNILKATLMNQHLLPAGLSLRMVPCLDRDQLQLAQQMVQLQHTHQVLTSPISEVAERILRRHRADNRLRLREAVTNLVSRLSPVPMVIREALYDLFPVSLYGLGLLYRVYGAVLRWCRDQSTVSIPHLQYS
jgi:hypothetical protein